MFVSYVCVAFFGFWFFLFSLSSRFREQGKWSKMDILSSAPTSPGILNT